MMPMVDVSGVGSNTRPASVRRGSRRALSGFLHDRRGNAAFLTGLLFPALVGFVGLGVDVVYWMTSQRSVQGAADEAAYSVASAITAGGNPTLANLTTEAKGVAASMGFVHGTGGVSVSLHNPPTTGAYAGNTTAYQVVITQPQPLFFAKLFQSTAPTVTGKAVAVRGGGGCILGLHATLPDTVLVDNNGQVSTPTCSVHSNSSSATGLHCHNNCTIAAPTYVVGDRSVHNNSYLTGSPNVTGAPPQADPYAHVALGTPPSTCKDDYASYPGPVSGENTTINLTPGRYCAGIDVQNNTTLNMASGVYWIDLRFNIYNNAILNANPPAGVTLIINGTYCIGFSCVPGMGIGNNSTLNIKAQPSGPYAGIAIFGPRNSTTLVTQEFGNNSYLNVQGAIYFPSQSVNFVNNSHFNNTLCTQVVAAKVRIQNNANMNTNCAGTGVAQIAKARLAE
jgi:Flp pilus assembly protein TadG